MGRIWHEATNGLTALSEPMRNIIVLGLTSLLTDISSEMVYPLLPMFLASLGGGPAVLGLIEGIAESTASLLKVFSGHVSDRLGRRRPLAIAGYSGSAAGKIILAAATGWNLVLLGRIADRIGKGIRTAPRDALISDSAEEGKRGRAFGLHRAMDTAGAATGVIIAIILLGLPGIDVRTVILWSLVPACGGVLLLFLVRETRRENASRPGLPPLQLSLLSPPLRRFLLITFLFTLGNSSNTFLLLRASRAHLLLRDVLLLYLAYNITYAFFSYPAGRLSDRFGRKSILVAGYGTYALAYLGFAFLPELADWRTFLGLFCLYGVFSGLTEGVEKALVSDLAGQSLRATAIGLHATIVGIGLLPASLIAGGLWDAFGPVAPFAFGSAMAALSALMLALFL
jgi:MFS family permease